MHNFQIEDSKWEAASESEVNAESEYYTPTGSVAHNKGLGRQEKAFYDCCRRSWKAGPRRIRREERVSIIDAVMSSDELLKPSCVVLQPTKEAWRTSRDSAWLLFHLGGLCDIWGVVISWWCDSFADNIRLNAAVDEEGEYWNQLTGTDTHLFPTFDRVTRIDFASVATTQIRLDLTGGHRDFLRKQYLFGIRQVEVIGRRADVFQPLWQPPEREVIEEGLRKVHRDERYKDTEEISQQDVYKKLYMPGEALKEAQELCRARQMPPWSLVMESGILDQVQVWPGTRERSRMQVPSKYRWTKLDPSHPFYWMSPRERAKKQHIQQMLQQSNDEDSVEEDVWEEWDNDSKSGWSPASTRPSSAQPSMRRPSTPLKHSASRASTRPTTADTSRGGSRPGTPQRYSGRPSSSSAYSYRFGGRPSTAGTRPSTAGNERPGSAPLQARRMTVREE